MKASTGAGTKTPSKSTRGRSAAIPRTGTSHAARKTPPPLSPEQLHDLIAEEAWLRAERRGFTDGDPVSDWLGAEQEVTRRLTGNPQQRD